jgi:hypothetical protein
MTPFLWVLVGFGLTHVFWALIALGVYWRFRKTIARELGLMETLPTIRSTRHWH